MLEIVSYFNFVLALTMSAAYFYQLIYLMYGVVSRKKPWIYVAQRQHRYAVLVSARNEEEVIGELIGSLRAQNYPRELLDICVVADNCTDRTAQVAREAGAIVYERFDTVNKGKGYALGYLLHELRADVGESGYDGFFVFDADNIIDPNFVAEMNKVFDTGEYQALTSYRNSKNFADNWITAGYGLWFMREARYLNFPRMLIGTNCAISGTGFLVSSKIIEENGGWPYHLLTEDIQFSAVCAANGWRIGYCDDAIVYDEQPVTFAQSWRQRMRWAKGFYQVNAHCGASLARGCLRGPRRFSCYDMLMTIAPCVLLTIAAVFVNLFCGVTILSLPPFLADFMLRHVGRSLLTMLLWSYGMMFVYGLLTVLAEWRRIPASPLKKVMYLPFFPLFMLTYIPISLAALLVRVEWKPIRHTSIEDVRA